jgi:hypothetical protein
MTKGAFDVDLATENLKISLGIKLDDELLKSKYENPRYFCIAKDFHPMRNLYMRSLKIDLENIEKNENIIEIAINKLLDDTLKEVDYFGWISVKNEKASTKEELLQSLSDALDLIKIDYVEY